jgi:glycosyltransferase involved in cell wall biosynthesis
VITACYNAADCIESAIDSLAAQTYPHIEHIVVDAGSRDGTVEIIKKHSGRISQWISEPDKGLADAWNKGIRMAKGDVIGLLNADDLYDATAIEKAVAALKPGDLALTYGDTVMFSRDIRHPESVVPGKFDPDLIYHGMGFMHTTCFVTSRVYREIGGFDTRYRIAVDTDFLMRCHVRNVEFRKTGSVTYMRTGGMSDVRWNSAYMEYLTQLYRHGFSKPRIGLAWAALMRKMAKERAGKWLGSFRPAPKGRSA